MPIGCLIVLVIFVVGAVLAIKFIPWYWIVAIVVAAFVLGKFVLSKLLVKALLAPFKAKGAVLHDAIASVAVIERVDPPSEASIRDALLGMNDPDDWDEDDDDRYDDEQADDERPERHTEAPIEDNEGRQNVRRIPDSDERELDSETEEVLREQMRDFARRDWYALEVTIEPKPATGHFSHWEPGELLLVDINKATDPESLNRDESDADELVIMHDYALKVEGAFIEDEYGKHEGPQTLRLIVGALPEADRLKFQYYFESFGNISLRT